MLLNHDRGFADLDDMTDARELNIDGLTLSRVPADPGLLLSSPSPTAFLEFVLDGGGGHLDPGVGEVIAANREALLDVGVSWEERLDALRCGRRV